MKNIMLFITFIFITSGVYASEDIINKTIIRDDINHQKAEKLHNDGAQKEAFEMHLLLAKVGDDRSQYNIGVSYSQGISGFMATDYVKAYAWIKVSITNRNSHMRATALNAIKQSLTSDELNMAEKYAKTYINNYGSGARVNQPYKITVQNRIASDNKICATTGTHIKDNCKDEIVAHKTLNHPIIW